MEQKLDNFIIINFIKAKSYGKTNFNDFVRKNIQLSQNINWRKQTALTLLVILAKYQVSEKIFLSKLRNMLMLLFSKVVICQIGMDGIESKPINCFLINKLLFHNLNFDSKNNMKYY